MGPLAIPSAGACASAAVAASASVAAATHPVKNFMVETLLSGPRMDRALSLLAAWRVFQRVDPKLHWGFRRLQGRIRARLLQNRGRATFGKRLIDISGIGTSARLCDRQKFGKVMVRTGRLSQFCLRFRHRDCNESRCFRAPRRQQAKPFSGTKNALA